MALGTWLAASGSAGAGTISGRARYEDRPVTNSGFGTSQFLPCRFNQVEIVLSDATVLGSGSTNESGNYSVTVPDRGTQTLFLRVYASQLTGNFRLVVANNNTAQATHTARSQNQSVNTNLASSIDIDIPVASAAGAFNIFDQGVKCQQLIRTLTGQVPPRLTFFWEVGSTNGTFFQPSLNAIFLLGASSDTDEYDDDVIIHETGHYMQANFSRDDSPGGQHAQSDEHQDLRVAWSEGSAYWWSGAVQGKAEQRDITGSGVSFFEMETPSNSALATGPDTETSVESILWDLFDTSSTSDSSPGTDDDSVSLTDGTDRIFDVMAQQFGSGRDTTFENFYQGWFRQHGAAFLKTDFDRLLARRSADFFRPNLFEASPALAIPDAGANVETTLSVPLSISLTGVRVFTDVGHRAATDLVVRLLHPDGTAVTLHSRTNTPARRDLFNWYEPFDASVATGQNLSAFNGKNGSGTWRLQLQDQVSSNTGRLNRWRLSLLGTATSPDLVVASVSGPASATPGGVIPVSTRIENRGVAGASANFGCSYVLSRSRTVSGTDPVLATFAVNGLDAGAGVNDSRDVTVPANTALGQYFVGVVADRTAVVAESSETNNTATAQNALSVVSPNTPADLVAASVTGASSSFPGGSLAVAARVENRGSTGVSSSFSNRYVLSTDQQIAGTDALLASFGLNALGPGEGFDDSRTATVPAALAQGSYFVGLLVDFDGAISEAAEGNNTVAAASPTQLGAPPSQGDLAALRALGPRSASVGATVLVSVAFENAGDTAITGLFSSGVFLSTDAQIAPSDIRLTTFSTNGVSPRQRIDRSVPAPLPASVLPGTYFLGALLDLDNTVAEAREDNNGIADAGGILLAPPPSAPDLEIVALAAPAAGSLGRSLSLTADVVNNGGSDITATFAVRFLLSRTRTPLAPVFGPVDIPLPGLAASAQQRVSATLTVPATLAAGDYFAGAIADPANAVNEATETNNSFAPATPTALAPPILADLEPVAMAIPSTAFLGGRLVARPSIANRGNGASGSFQGEFLLSKSRTNLSSAVSLGLRAFETVAAGATRAFEVSLDVPTAIAQGAYSVALRVDPRGEIDESDETDNTLVTTATVNLIEPVLPDLTVVSVEAPGQVEAATSMSVRRSIKNQGNAAMTSVFSEALVLSTSSTVSQGAQRIVTFGNAPLAAGAVSSETRLVTIPATLAAGSYFFGVLADPDDRVLEIDESNNGQAALAPTVVTPSQKADLVLESVSVPASIDATQPFQLVRTVRNASQFATVRGFSEVAYLSVDSRITTADLPLASFIGTTLGPGASNTATRTVQLPQNTPGGTFFIGLIVDASGVVDESLESNNALATTSSVTVRANGVLPDLVPTDLSGPTAGTAGSAITLSRRIENLGRGSLVGTADEAYFLSTDAVITTTDLRIGTFSVGPLATGGVSVESRSVTLPSTLPAGTYFPGVIVDPDNRVIEGDPLGDIAAGEANNDLPAFTRLTVGPAGGGRVDLAPLVVTVPREVQVGGQLSVAATVENRGTLESGTFDVRFFLSTNKVVDAGTDVVLGTLSSATLAVGGRTTLQGFFTVPSNQPVGNYFVLIQSDPANRIPEADEANNLLASDLVSVSTSLTLADLAAGTVNFSPPRVETGQALSLSWTVRNAGGRPAPAFRIQFFASTDSSVGPPDTQLASLELPTLPAGSSFSDVTSAAVPTVLATGAYFVGLLCDGDDRVLEADERNNSVLAPATLAVGPVLAGPDLVALTPLAPTSAVVGGILPVTLRVRNRGPLPVTGDFVNRLFLSTDAIVDAGDVQLAEYTVAGLPQTSETTRSQNVTLPRRPPGAYKLLLRVDATGVAVEDDESNNTSVAGIVLRGAPDLRIDAFVAPELLRTGVSAPAELTIGNGGNANATGPILSRIVLSFDDVIDASDLVLKPAVFPGDIAAGGQASVSTTFAVPAFVTPGAYRLVAVVDPGNALSEEDESNNARDLGAPVSIGGAAELTAQSVSGPAAIVSGGGDELTLSFSVRNTGSATAGASDAGFFLSTDAVPSTGDAFVGSVRVGALSSGESSALEGRFPLPGSFAPGDYFVVVRVDLSGSVPEPDESDASNTAVSASPVRVLAGTTGRPRVTRLTVSRVNAAAAGAGPMTIVAEYDRELASAPVASVDQPGTNDLAAVAMTGGGRTWTLGYVIPADNGTFNRDGANRLTITGGRDVFGVDAEPFTSAAAFVTDTIAPVARLSFPGSGAVVGGAVLVSGSVADASDRVAVTVSADGDSPRQAVVSGGRFDQAVTLSGDRPVIRVRCVDPAGNAGADVVVSVQLDSDGDGLPDAFERASGLDPSNATDAASDADADGLTALQEFGAGTDARLADTDGDGASDSVEVAQGTDPSHAGNSPPVARAREGVSSARGTGPRVATLDGSGSSDPDGDSLGFAWTQQSGPQSVLQRAGAALPSAVVRAAGTYVYRLVVSDGKVESPAAQASVSVANVAPTAAAGPEQTVSVNQRVQLDGTASSDPNGDLLTYTWTPSAANPAAVSLVDPAGPGPSFTPVRAGRYEFTLRVTDPLGLASPTAKTVVRAMDPEARVLAPRADAGLDETVDAGSRVVLDAHESVDPDAPGLPLSYRWTQTSGPPGVARVTLTGSTSSAPSFDARAAGVYVFQLTVTDGFDDGLESAPDNVSIRVNGASQSLPLAVPGPDRVLALGETAILDGTGSVVRGGATLAYQWTKVSGPPVTLEAAAEAIAAATPVMAGTYVFELVVTAGGVNSEPARVRVDVAGTGSDRPPVARARLASPVSSVAGENRVRIPAGGTLAVQLDADESFDPEGAALGVRWRQVAGPTVVLSSETAARPSFTPLVSRVYGFELTVSDGRLEATTSIDIVVDSPFNSVPRASVAVAPAARAGSAVTLDGGRSADPDGGALLYRWVQTGGVPVTSTSARVARFSFVPPVAGLYRFRLFVDDGRDRSTPQEVTVNAAAPATPGGSGSTGGTPAAAGGGGGGGCALGEGGGALEPSVLLAALLAWLLALRCRRPA